MSSPSLRAGAVLAAVFLAWAAAASPGRAQSLMSASGLGVPVDPLAARARGLGSVGVGLPAGTILPTDPAGAVGVPLPTVTGTLQPTVGTTQGLGPDADLSTTRFPLFGLAYPLGPDKVITFTVGSYLDQNWALNVDGSVPLAGEQVGVTDEFLSEGGVSTLRVGWGQAVTERVTVGASAGLHVGELTRSFTRSFDSVGVGRDVEQFDQSGRWRLSGPTASLGITVEPLDVLRLAASLSWSGDLEAEPRGDTRGPGRDFPLPVRYRMGATLSLTPELGAHAGFAWADWSDTGEALTQGSSRGGTASLGGGVEWSGLRLLNRSFPLRLGVRNSQLPFRFAGAAPTELIFSTGLGMNLVESDDGIPLAALDFAVELGDRDAGAVSESFTRFSASLRVSGN